VSDYPTTWFSAGCRRCPRLAAHLDQVRRDQPDYHARPVPAFGPAGAALLIVGLAPGMHGANRTGRPFTGDYAGVLLYESLHALGLASRPDSISRDDGLVLKDVRITNAVKCLPPANKPTGAEVRQCNAYLAAELAGGRPRAVLALGRIAHDASIRALGLKPSAYRFGHGAEHVLDSGPVIVDSYHCSRYNTQTRRLTEEMFLSALDKAARLAGVPESR
jgi:uracil-DNA glycosylase family 4